MQKCIFDGSRGLLGVALFSGKGLEGNRGGTPNPSKSAFAALFCAKFIVKMQFF
jgi:hypothetical protein